ncbi:TPR repeat-containing protein [Rhodopirellula maiorica SM1]|uniref:TPR repeat-containing protein n=1 Tax=Rhodopirellula maiorica SM1 TaxID=1265738 RepID=M5RS65_9BACT|nr:glycosyltransferase family 61 protein [Rhodopirellula maiorica]EMI22056.1 TPR repeat-containing protein [Rhodopirellula maiorica SM1]
MKIREYETPLSGEMVDRPLPSNVDPRHRDRFISLQHERLAHPKIEIYQNAEVRGRGPVFSQGRPIAESFAAPPCLNRWHRRYGPAKAAIESWLSRPQTLETPALWITDNWCSNYYHWMCDTLPRLELAAMHCDLPSMTLLLPAQLRRMKFVSESLRSYELNEVRFLQRFERIRCCELTMPSHVASCGNVRPPMIQALRNRFLNQISQLNDADASSEHCSPIDSSRIYISRRNAKRRRIENERAILPVLAEHGFRTVVAEDLTWTQQLRIFSRARCVVTNHGAGLTNILMMAPGSQVLEITGDDSFSVPCFHSLASASQLDYRYLVVDQANARSSSHDGHLRVAPSSLDRTLSEMLSPRHATDSPQRRTA